MKYPSSSEQSSFFIHLLYCKAWNFNIFLPRVHLVEEVVPGVSVYYVNIFVRQQTEKYCSLMV